MRERRFVYTGKEKIRIIAEPGTKLRPGVRLLPGGHVILLPTQIMAIMELAGVARCRHQCSAWVICQVGIDMSGGAVGQTGRESLTLIFFSEFMKMAQCGTRPVWFLWVICATRSGGALSSAYQMISVLSSHLLSPHPPVPCLSSWIIFFFCCWISCVFGDPRLSPPTSVSSVKDFQHIISCSLKNPQPERWSLAAQEARVIRSPTLAYRVWVMCALQCK